MVEGHAEVEITKLIKQHKISYLACSECPGTYEKQQLNKLREAAPHLTILQENTDTLFNQFDLPFELPDLPKHFTPFRKKVESLTIDAPLKAPDWLPPPPETATQNFFSIQTAPTNSPLFKGGAVEAKKRLNYYSYQSQKLLNYKQTRNGLLAFDDSTKLSPWLANGNISAKEVYHHVKRFERDIQANESTYWLYFELLWREYFQWYLYKHGTRVFQFSGVKGTSPLTSFWPERFEKWRTGNTPWPIVNAAMRQLNSTGYMSNRARQLVASCLVHELNLDWRYGAAWFEQQLVDFDVAVNWGNWQYLAGVGADPRGHRRFDLEKQAKQYDPDGSFIKTWLTHQEIEQMTASKIDSTDMVDWPC
ncbi:cryptochrome DASH [Planctobacterium marinum]|uniref:Cryptochrome DASH n=2 Tax=Planctobacterium marinum TaxID=1631968 RepID=A0AA48HUG5_9ALTE|nr:cryptochrome DASH [Planctobacterium marinum]